MAIGGTFTLADAAINITGKVAPGLNKALGDAESAVKKNMGNILALTSKVGAGMAIAGGAIVGAFTAAVLKTGQYADQIDEMSQRTGFGTDALQELKYAADQSGGSLEGLETMAKRMAKSVDAMRLQTEKGQAKLEALGKASEMIEPEMKGAAEAIGRLGLNFSQLKDLKPEDQFAMLASKLADVEDETTKAALAQQIFGRAGTDILPMLAEGSKGLQAMRDRAHELGLVMGNEAVKKAAAFNDKLDSLKKQFTGVAMSIGIKLIPAITPLLEKLERGGIWLADWISKHKELAERIVIAVAAIAGLNLGMGSLLMSLPTLISGLTQIGLILFNPMGLVTALTLLVGPLGLLTHFNDSVFEFVNNLSPKLAIALDTIGGTLADIGRALMNILTTIWDIIEAVYNLIFARGKYADKFDEGGSDKYLTGIPMFAGGTSFAPGGLSLVGERGPELVNLPRGSQVYNASQSAGMMGAGKVELHLHTTGEITPAKAKQIGRMVFKELKGRRG